MGKLMHEIRGFRNNNPGNLEKSKSFKWDGEVKSLSGIPTESRFCQFQNIDYGVRAIFRLLKTYREKYELKTVESIIPRWAPGIENDTISYIDHVVKTLNLYYPTENIGAIDQLAEKNYCGMCCGIITHENGFFPFLPGYLEDIFAWAVPEWNIK